MSILENNLKSGSSSSLVDKILEQGQRLRNSMVQTVLNNDPFNKEILNSYNNSRTNVENRNIFSLKSTTCDRNNKPRHSYQNNDYIRVQKYLRGDDMCLNEETKALETLRSMSPNTLIQSTSGVQNLCHCKDSCDICNEYENKLVTDSTTSFVSDRKNKSTARISHEKSSKSSLLNIIEEKNSKELKSKDSSSKLKSVKKTFHGNQYLLKYVDSLKINVYSLKLNAAGNRKIMASENMNKPYLSSTNTYFIEYTLPDILIKNVTKSRAKVNTGLNPDKTIRFCSKKLQNESIYFKQQSIHQITHVNLIDLSNVRIDFRVSFRSVKQRTALLIGKASFNLGFLITNQFFTSEQELVLINENAPVVLGNLKVSLQFGCDKLYFGKEFIEAISCSKENTNLSESDSIHKSDNERTFKTKTDKILTDQNVTDRESKSNKSEVISAYKNLTVNKPNDETHLLYALIHISEVRLLSNPLNSYIICRGFSRDDTVTSRTVYNDFKPIFNLYQIIPVLLDENFVCRLRDNYVIVEVWEKKNVDNLLGISKLSLHQLYVAYRNPAIVKHLVKNKHPVIGVDWWEPVTHPVSHSEAGQLRALVALGSSTQIETLEQNRSLKYFPDKIPLKEKSIEITEDLPKFTSLTSLDDTNIPDKLSSRPYDSSKAIHEKPDFLKSNIIKETIRKTILVSDKYVQQPEIEISPSVVTLTKTIDTCSQTEKVDASTQSEIFEMSSDRDHKNPSTNNTQLTQKDFLNSFLEQLISARDLGNKNKHVENSTNTDDLVPETAKILATETSAAEKQIDPNMNQSNTNLSVRNTSDLLDSLQKALSLGNKNEKLQTLNNEPSVSEFFKAHVVIESALHLPSRKKCKSKRNKTKSPKSNEEILPSSYVTFKGSNDSDYVMTSVVPKSTSPTWDYRCDINLPSELLLNNQKRLIFKVWRKANGPSLQPNFQTDIVLGFAALDLTVLLSGLPNVQGWFNIVDFSSKCNGQIKIHVTPLENLSKFAEYRRSYVPEKLRIDSNSVNLPILPEKNLRQEVCDDSVPSELFSRALKRKFTELDEITQRLRQRLTAVTNDDSDLSNDDFVDEFERDLNTICVDTEPFDFSQEKITKNQSVGSEIATSSKIDLNVGTSVETSSTTSEINVPTVQENLNKLDTHLTEGKLKIDSLLEKLTLLTGDNEHQNKSDRSFSSRYVSGCSVTQEPENSVSKDFGKTDLDPDLIFNPLLFQQMFTASIDSTPRLDSLECLSDVHCTTLKNLVQDSTSSGSSRDLQSISSNSLSDHVVRQAPEGAGNTSNH